MVYLAFNPETDRPNRVKLTTWKRTGWDPEALPNPLEDLKCEQKLLSLGWEISAFILQDFQVTAAFWWHFEIPLTRHNRIVGLSDTASSCSVRTCPLFRVGSQRRSVRTAHMQRRELLYEAG